MGRIRGILVIVKGVVMKSPIVLFPDEVKPQEPFVFIGCMGDRIELTWYQAKFLMEIHKKMGKIGAMKALKLKDLNLKDVKAIIEYLEICPGL
jgi:hypothetical protein